MPKFSSPKVKSTIFVLVAIFLLTTGFGCRTIKPEVQEKIQPINLIYWRVWDSPDTFSDIINNFRNIYPHISITYRKLRFEEFEQTLLEALAEDRGPDLISLPSTHLKKYQNKLLPMPEKTVIARKVVTGKIKKQEKIILETKTMPTLRDLRDNFVDVVTKDVVIDNQIYGLPLFLDTLVLYYNRDLLNQTGVSQPPATWQEFTEAVKKITLIDQKGDFIYVGAGLGRANNVSRYADILSLLMLQNQTPMTNEAGQPTFNRPLADDPNYFPGAEALRFYTDFANPTKETYTWNEKMPNSLEAFIQGRLAFFLGYSYHLPIIKTQAPKLNFDLAKVPQIEKTLKEVNFANYWVETVSQKTKYPNEAWTFLSFATQAQQAKTFLERAKKPTAHRALIKDQLTDFDLEVFASQSLTADSWYRGKDWAKVEETFAEIIELVNQGRKNVKQAIDMGVERLKE